MWSRKGKKIPRNRRIHVQFKGQTVLFYKFSEVIMNGLGAGGPIHYDIWIHSLQYFQCWLILRSDLTFGLSDVEYVSTFCFSTSGLFSALGHIRSWYFSTFSPSTFSQCIVNIQYIVYFHTGAEKLTKWFYLNYLIYVYLSINHCLFYLSSLWKYLTNRTQYRRAEEQMFLLKFLMFASTKPIF
jgi:hypothetical protein